MTLPSSLPLSVARIAELRTGNAQDLAILTVATTGSTNADLLAAIQADPVQMRPTLLAARMQTSGRGRAGRVWHSEPDAALTFSLAWKFDRPVQHLAGLPLAVGVALAEALATLGQSVKLKWPNDLLSDGKKLGGILIETADAKLTVGEATWAVIGIGLNLSLPAEVLAQFGSVNASALSVLERELVLARLIDHLGTALAVFGQEGFAAFATRWNGHHAHAGQAVRIIDRGVVLHEGIAAGVDQTGCLLLDTNAGRVAVLAGDVSLRLQHQD